MNNKHQAVQQYYGKKITKTADLKTNACCEIAPPPKHIAEILPLIHNEVKDKYYGCGLTIPSEIEGVRILDLGSGSGRDCFIASKLVGQKGMVVGVDMTEEQLAVANKFIDYHTRQFGYSYANVKFLKGNIEQLDQLELTPQSFDLIVSNCVINLATDKAKVFKDACRLLKPGGELYFSDVYSDRRISKSLQRDAELWGECLSGALYWNDFLRIARQAGFTDPRSVSSKAIVVENEKVAEKLGDIQFFSVTYRLFKIAELEQDCEDYGQAVRYLGSIGEQSASFTLDDHHNFPAGKIMPVCGNTFLMLQQTRFAPHFEFFGNFDTHYGIFEGCGGAMPFSTDDQQAPAGSCC